MELYKRKDGRSPFWFFDAVDDKGNRVRRSTKQTDKRKAMQVALDMLASDPKVTKEITLGDAADKYVDKLKANGKSWQLTQKIFEKTFARDATTTKGDVRWAGRFRLDEKRHLSTLSQSDIEALRTARGVEGNKPGTIANELRQLRAMARHAAKGLGMKGCSVDAWGVPKDHEKTRYLTGDEARAALRILHPDTPRLMGRSSVPEVVQGTHRRWLQDAHDLLLAYILTGGRCMEVNRLTVPQVNLQTRTVKLLGKGNKARELPLVEEAVEMFTRRVEEAKAEKRVLLFPGKEGKVRHGGSRAVRRALDAAGCNPPELVSQFGAATIHSLRHTYASWLRQRGIGLDELPPLLGHTTMAMSNRYKHVPDEERIARVHAAFSKVGTLGHTSDTPSAHSAKNKHESAD